MYLKATEHTYLNLALWTLLLVYLYNCVIVPIISEARKPMRPNNQTEAEYIISEVLSSTLDDSITEHDISISEISFFVEDTKTYLTVLRDLRKDSPGMFCLFMSSVLILTCYYGSFVSTGTLVYLLSMASLLLPITMKLAMKKLPEKVPMLRK